VHPTINATLGTIDRITSKLNRQAKKLLQESLKNHFKSSPLTGRLLKEMQEVKVTIEDVQTFMLKHGKKPRLTQG